jgi:phytoene dehydrogenase-like protein
LTGGGSWHQEKQRAIDLNFATIDSHAPNFRASVDGHSALSPIDLEEKLGLAAADIFHGALGLDQLWPARPMLGYGDYRTPLKSLYLCGCGAHPGGGATGVPAHNAAREIIRDGVSPNS